MTISNGYTIYCICMVKSWMPAKNFSKGEANSQSRIMDLIHTVVNVLCSPIVQYLPRNNYSKYPAHVRGPSIKLKLLVAVVLGGGGYPSHPICMRKLSFTLTSMRLAGRRWELPIVIAW